jgi:hypothetical protein
MPASALLRTGGRRESCVYRVADRERRNIIYVRHGPSGPIFSFLIHFKF